MLVEGGFPAKVLVVDLDAARAFLRDHHRGVLATRQADGGVQQSPVLVNVDAEGRVIVSSRPEAMDPLIDYYKRFPDENPEWDDYRARMERERRVLIRLEIERAGPDRQG